MQIDTQFPLLLNKIMQDANNQNSIDFLINSYQQLIKLVSDSFDLDTSVLFVRKDGNLQANNEISTPIKIKCSIEQQIYCNCKQIEKDKQIFFCD